MLGDIICITGGAVLFYVHVKDEPRGRFSSRPLGFGWGLGFRALRIRNVWGPQGHVGIMREVRNVHIRLT